MLYFMQGKPEISERYFRRSAAASERVLEGNPFDFWTHLDMTTAQLVLGNAEEAMRHLEAAIQQLQNPRPLEIFLGDLLRLRNAPKPPQGIDDVIKRVQEGIDKLRAQTDT
jgi:hypothetical protein